MRSYPKETCIAPPIKSMVIDNCGNKCKSTVTIIHDMSSDMHGRSNLITDLSKNHKVLVFQNRGHYNVSYDKKGHYIGEGNDGTSTSIPKYIPDPVKCKEEHGIDAYTIEMFVNDTKRVMDKHGIDKSDLVGFSLGSVVAQAFASKYPDRTGKIAIGKSFTKYHDWITGGKKIINPIFPSVYWVWCTTRPKLYKERDYGCNVPMPVLDAMGKHFYDLDMTKYQIDIGAPTLVIHCKDDDAVGTPVTNIKHMKEIKMDFCGHIANAKNDAMYKEIVNFLK